MSQTRDSVLHHIIGPRLVTAPIADRVVCDDCGSDAVALSELSGHSDDRWWAVLRCGGCGRWYELAIDQAAADRLIAMLDVGLTAIARDLEAVDRERMATQVEAFATALELDLIDAGDFDDRPRYRRARAGSDGD
jgi:hypothetical protein